MNYCTDLWNGAFSWPWLIAAVICFICGYGCGVNTTNYKRDRER